MLDYATLANLVCADTDKDSILSLMMNEWGVSYGQAIEIMLADVMPLVKKDIKSLTREAALLLRLEKEFIDYYKGLFKDTVKLN